MLINYFHKAKMKTKYKYNLNLTQFYWLLWWLKAILNVMPLSHFRLSPYANNPIPKIQSISPVCSQHQSFQSNKFHSSSLQTQLLPPGHNYMKEMNQILTIFKNMFHNYHSYNFKKASWWKPVVGDKTDIIVYQFVSHTGTFACIRKQTSSIWASFLPMLFRYSLSPSF